MLATLRTYRVLSAALAVLLVMGTSTALVQHVCAMVGLIGMVQMESHACAGHGEAEPHDAPSVMPCHAAADSGIRSLPGAAHDDCCIIQADTPPAEAVRLSSSVVDQIAPLTVAALILPPEKHGPCRPAVYVPDGSPPRSPVSLHILNATFLI